VDLNEKLRLIESKDDLGEFVGQLLEDLNSNPNAWENETLDRYLEAMQAWILDSEASDQKAGVVRPEPTWRTFAEILSAARIYE
jgi:hypothetical protein